MKYVTLIAIAASLSIGLSVPTVAQAQTVSADTLAALQPSGMQPAPKRKSLSVNEKDRLVSQARLKLCTIDRAGRSFEVRNLSVERPDLVLIVTC
jgi:hypothetical protein